MLIDDILYCVPRMPNKSHLYEYLALGLTKALRFQVDNVARYVHDNNPPGERFNAPEKIPNIAPLASQMWFEYGGVAIGQRALNQFGCFLALDYDRDSSWRAAKWEGVDIPDNVRWILRAECFCMGSVGISSSDYIYFFSVGDDGQPLDFHSMESHRGNFTPDESQKEKLDEVIAVALTAICFSHCKGTEIEEHHPSRQVRRASERAGKPVFTFHTIDIEPSRKVLRAEGRVSENGLAKALHICRGHFAHYTAEHPLFGKYTGTFYRPMHVRGSVESGVAVKDYRVHPQKETVKS